MAGKIPDLEATERTGTGKGAARQARRDDMVPGIVYGGGVDPLPINIPFNYLLTRLRKGRFLATLFNLKVEGHKDVRVICRDVQRDVVKDLPRHIDFMRLRQTSRVDLFLTVEFINHEESPGLSKGGVLVVIRQEIEFNVRANNIPEHIVVDLAGLDFGDVVTISMIDLPEGVKPVIDRDFAIANVSAPSIVLTEEEEAEAAEAAEANEEDGEEAEKE
jgi:large subunit ribosomal protein L25